MLGLPAPGTLYNAFWPGEEGGVDGDGDGDGDGDDTGGGPA